MNLAYLFLDAKEHNGATGTRTQTTQKVGSLSRALRYHYAIAPNINPTNLINGNYKARALDLRRSN